MIYLVIGVLYQKQAICTSLAFIDGKSRPLVKLMGEVIERVVEAYRLHLQV